MANKAEYCYSRCPHFQWARKNGSLFVNCAVLPLEMEIEAEPDEADDLYRDVERKALVVLPIPCQVISPIQELGTIDLYKRA